MTRRPTGLGPCDLLTVPQACAVLGMAESDARALLQERGLVRLYAGRPRVVAGELVAADDARWQRRDALPTPARLPSWDDLEEER